MEFIRGGGNYDIIFVGNSITVKSANGPDNCIIDCQHLGRGFWAYSGETITLTGLTVVNGDASGHSGGAFYAQDSNVIIFNCVFDSNRGGGGGAVNTSLPSTFTNCVFTSNYASSSGGAVSSSSSSTFTNCTFTSNSASANGGAVASSSSSFDSCTFNLNYANDDGGAVSFGPSSIFADCTFDSNISKKSGGAVFSGYSSSSSPLSSSFNRCTFTNNNSIRGGATYVEHSYSSSYENCLFVGNSASYGGAVYSCSIYASSVSSSSFVNSTFTLNEATEQGGAFWYGIRPPQPITVKNCIIWNDSSPEGPEIYAVSQPLVVTYSDIQHSYGGFGNLSANPLFLSSSTTDLYLHPYSPCIDGGTSDGAPGDDIDGYIRPIGHGYDMGAYEYRNDVYIWEGQTSSWDEAGNWNGGEIPGRTNSTIISSVQASVNPEVNIDEAAVGKLLIESGILTIHQGMLTIGGS